MENILEFQIRKEQEYLNNLLDSINNLLNYKLEFSEDTKEQLEIEKNNIGKIKCMENSRQSCRRIKERY